MASSRCGAMLLICDSCASWANPVESESISVAISNDKNNKCFNFGDGQEDRQEPISLIVIPESGHRPSSGGYCAKYAETNQEPADLFAEEC